MSEEQNNNQEVEVVVDYHDQVAMRKHKLTEMRKEGNAYPNDSKPDSFAGDILTKFQDATKEELENEATTFKLCGRVMNRRVMGKASFIHIQDFTGKIQAYIRKDRLADGVYDSFKHWDLGDIVCVSGTIFRTKTGEITLNAGDIKLLTKSLRPLPDKYHGLAEKELKYRNRYLDLLTNEATRAVFAVRSKTISTIRGFFEDRRFLEVETPMMHNIPGGAAARPFTTFHNALGIPLYMRVAPELFLKRLVVGGLDRVFEINRNFRNEGLSRRHNPEFTMLEFYEAYADYNDFMDLVETLLRLVATEVLQQEQITFEGDSIDFSQPFTRLSVTEAILRYNPDMQPVELENIEFAKDFATRVEIAFDEDITLGNLKLEIFEKTVEKQLINPTFITDYPIETSPLSRANDKDPTIVDRCELFIAGYEIANIFSELNDPEDQAQRFEEQAKAHSSGDAEAMLYDESYVEALEHGLPPTAGAGIGIDRLVMLLTDSASIKDVILFPLLRPVSADNNV
jgi:lysyl-tRNA synthetase, class II